MKDVYVSLDLEMTSGRAETQEVIEVGAIKFRGDRVLATWSKLIKPSVPLPYNVQILTGIRPEDLARAPVLADVADELVAFLGKLPLVAHTVSSDVGCLRRQGIVLDNPQIDTFELASVLLPRMPSYSLAALAQHFGIPFPRQHRAVSDALVTKQLLLALFERARALDLSLLQEINRLVSPFDWPLKVVFRDAEAHQARATAGGASIREQLLAKSAGGDLPLEVLLLTPPDEEPLRRAPRREPLDGDRLAGELARLPGFEGRAPRPELVRAVARALDGGERLLVEVEPGPARPLGYLLPSVGFATANGEPVVVAAGTPGLQEQLFRRELPDLAQSLPTPFRTALLKPRESYLCFRRWAALRRRADLSFTEALVLVKTLVWLPTTETGDVAELNLTDEERALWRRVSVDDDDCDPEACQFASRGVCFLARARQAARSAHVVVTSHAVALSDLSATTRLLPDYRHLIVEEAHHLEDEATLRLGSQVRFGDLLAYLEGLHLPTGLPFDLSSYLRRGALRAAEREGLEAALAALEAAARGAGEAAERLGLALASFSREVNRESRGFEQRARLTKAARAKPSWQAAHAAWEAFDLQLAGVQSALDRLDSLLDDLPSQRFDDREALRGRVRAARGFARRVRDELAGAFAARAASQVYWLSSRGDAEFALHRAPVHVGEALARDLFGPRASVVLVSNALAVEGSFDYVKGRLGLEGASDLVIGRADESPTTTLVYLPTDVPEPEQPSYQERLQQSLVELCSAARGRTLALFTSHSQLRQTWKGIQKRLAERGVLTIGQGVDGAGRRSILQAFRLNPRSVLLATGSFWESPEVVGEGLSLLVIPRLPFAPPGDPVVAARSEGLRDPLNEYSLPHTILRFRQGVGRIGGAKPGRGVVVVFDRRVQTKSYGQAFLRSLPAAVVREGPARELPRAALEWLGEA